MRLPLVNPVEIMPMQGTLVLRARGSELLILSHHVAELKERKNAADFTGYFMNDALINRPARKLFEAWLRKDRSLWNRIYATVKEIEDIPEQDSVEKDSKENEAPKQAAKSEKADEKSEKSEKSEKPAKKATAKKATAKKATAKKATAKKATAKKATAKKATAKKATAKKKASK